MLDDRKSLQTEIDAIQWYHEFRFPGGEVARSKTPDAATHRALWQFIEGELDRIDFNGRTVLDIGCWDGYWSFYAERRGASYVLATDDQTQNWAGDSGLALAKRLLGSKIDTNTSMSIYDLAKLNRTFDVILCPGVYYHLLDPFYAFAQVRHCCHPGTVVVFEGDAIFTGHDPGIYTCAYYSADANKAPRFRPEIHTLRDMLRATYFNIEHEAVHEIDGMPGTNRTLLRCRPMSGLNEYHVYPPPFGLAKYDQRWG